MKLFKEYIKSTQAVLFILLSCFSIVFIIIMYFASSIHAEKEFVQYKKEYYTEQTYNMSYIFSMNIKNSLGSEENEALYKTMSQKFSTHIEFLNEDLNKVIYTPDKEDYEKDPALFYVDAPIFLNDETQGYLRAYYNLDNQVLSPALTRLQRNLQDQRALFVQIAIVLLIASAFVISKILARQVNESSISALQVLRGNREITLERRGTTEMKQLIDTVNGLLTEFNNMENWRKQMLEDLTHELRTPLTSVLTMLEAIIDGVYSAKKETMQEIYEEVDRLSRLIINVQNLSEAEGARFDLNIQKVNIVDLIKGIYDGFLFVAKQKEIKLQFKYANKPCIADVDPDRFIQIITNIISNALKYTPREGNVEIGLESNENEMVFYCLDNGMGISEENQLLVFNRFFRTDQSRSRESGGSGIGLNISKALVEAHEGEIGVESKLGEGSRFWVKLSVNNNVNVEIKDPQVTLTMIS